MLLMNRPHDCLWSPPTSRGERDCQNSQPVQYLGYRGIPHFFTPGAQPMDEQQKLAFEQEKWRTDIALRSRELELKKAEERRRNGFFGRFDPMSVGRCTAALALVGTLITTTMQRLGKTNGIVASVPPPPLLPAGGHATPGVCTRAAAGQLRPPACSGLMAGVAPRSCLGLDTRRRTGADRQGRRGGNAREKAAGASWLAGVVLGVLRR